uniref:Uncharacterized protein n=1 Tax=Utricularia reniformis TaxID=192314 RepID=A0A1Y0B446_9LAMI|nr:hypothetical protein AEK19_MT2002 [Utricularia reniformis]ART32163.1 hypothetical protein AEK19_MT2002 [Utricularia reniformis]
MCLVAVCNSTSFPPACPIFVSQSSESARGASHREPRCGNSMS